VAERHPEAEWVFIYTREAHPGENVGHHDTFDRKLANARLLRDEIGIRRPILVDTLAGDAHRRYGARPNMTWVLDRGGRVVYKANWTNAANVESFLERYLAGRGERRAGVGMAMYETEQIEFHRTDHKQFEERLRRNGPRALEEFDRAKGPRSRGGAQ
jgi:hypothetical protein